MRVASRIAATKNVNMTRSFRLPPPASAISFAISVITALLWMETTAGVASFLHPVVQYSRRSPTCTYLSFSSSSSSSWAHPTRRKNNRHYHYVPRSSCSTLVCYYSSLDDDRLDDEYDDIGIRRITNEWARCSYYSNNFISSSSSPLAVLVVVIPSEKRSITISSKRNHRMLMTVLHAKQPTTRIDDTEEEDVSEGSTNTNDETNGNDDVINNDDQPAYRSKIRLQTSLQASRRNRTKILYRQLPSIPQSQQQKQQLPSIPQNQQKQKPKQGIAQKKTSTQSSTSSSPSSYEQRKRQIAENQIPQPNPTKTTTFPPKKQQPTIIPPKPTTTKKFQRQLHQNLPPPTTIQHQNQESLIDSFLRGDYDNPYPTQAYAPAPHPNLTPGECVEVALRSLRNLDEPEVDHGAAVFASFCAELKRGERWGGSVANRRVGVVVGGDGEKGSSSGASLWKEILRGALTPTMFARRIRSSDEFSILLDWERLDVTDGMAVSPSYYLGQRQVLGITGSETVAFVNAAFFW